jgi:transcriptional regulator with XRE-family HTH domain
LAFRRLLSHYENGIREPRLEFVLKACDYYGVSADYILGRTAEKTRDGVTLKCRSADERPMPTRRLSLSPLLEEIDDARLRESAANYMNFIIYVIASALRLKRRPYEPLFDAAMKLAEAAFIQTPAAPTAPKPPKSCRTTRLRKNIRSSITRCSKWRKTSKGKLRAWSSPKPATDAETRFAEVTVFGVYPMIQQDSIRNFSIIAHIDHGNQRWPTVSWKNATPWTRGIWKTSFLTAWTSSGSAASPSKRMPSGFPIRPGTAGLIRST